MYEKSLVVNDGHIDFHGIVDGLYYPFYYEEVRHEFIKDVVGVDIREAAKSGVNYVLVSYELKFRKPLKKGDRMSVCCSLDKAEGREEFFMFKQKIKVDGKLYSSANFIATCVSADGGRPYMSDEVKEKLGQS